MNNQPSSKKAYIITGIVVVVAILVYFYWNGSGTPASTSLEATNAEDDAARARVISLLNQVSALRIETDLFKDKMYTTLIDYTINIPPIPVGRINPFAPIPGEARTVGTTGTGN